MILKLAKILTRLQTKHSKYFLSLFVILTLLLLPGIVLLPGHVEPSLEKVMPSFIQELQSVNYMRTQFGSDITYIILEAIGPIYDVREKESLKFIGILERAFQQRELVIGTESIASRYGENNERPRDIVALDLMSSSYDMTIIKVITDTGADANSIEELLAGLNNDMAQLDNLNPGFNIKVTGFNVLDKLTFNVIMGDFLVITGVSMSLIAFLLWLFFRDFKRVLLSMSVLFFSVLWTMGVVGYMGLTITVVSMVSIAMLMGLGIDFSVHMMHTFYDYHKKNSASKSIFLTHNELLRAVVGAAATTIAGFLALLFGVLPAMQTLAIILAIGISNTLIGAIGLMPILLYLSESKNLNEV